MSRMFLVVIALMLIGRPEAADSTCTAVKSATVKDTAAAEAFIDTQDVFSLEARRQVLEDRLSKTRHMRDSLLKILSLLL